MNNQEYCPQCPNHCSKDALSCGKGRAYFNMDNNSQSKENAHHQPRQAEQGVVGLLRQCGHMLHHNPNVSVKLCNALSKDEQQTLEQLLNKILSSVK